MKITFDPGKHRAALSDRGLDFDDAATVFAGPTITVQDTRRDYGEARFQTVGFLADRMVMVVWTPRDEARHLISSMIRKSGYRFSVRSCDKIENLDHDPIRLDRIMV